MLHDTIQPFHSLFQHDQFWKSANKEFTFHLWNEMVDWDIGIGSAKSYSLSELIWLTEHYESDYNHSKIV